VIASINPEYDVSIYLSLEDIAQLTSYRLEGALIRLHDPRKKGLLTLEINDARNHERGFGIGFNADRYRNISDNFVLEVFLGSNFYKCLAKQTVVTNRHNLKDGAKVHMYPDDPRHESVIEDLEYYRDASSA